MVPDTYHREVITTCYMAIYPAGVLPSSRHLANAAALNTDGYGWAVGTDEVYHSLDGTAAIQGFTSVRLARPQEPAMFHARTATGGTPATLANCQPLALDDGSVIAHNGALYPPIDGVCSDSREFAATHLGDWDLDDEDDRTELEQIIGWNKIAIFRAGREPLILNDHQGIWLDDGSWHSNEDYTGLSHTRAGQCGACRQPDPELPQASLCRDCRNAYNHRWQALEEGRLRP